MRIILSLVLAVATLTGCATDNPDYKLYLNAQTEIMKTQQKPLLVIRAAPGQQITGLESIEVNAPAQNSGAGVANLQAPRSNEWAGVVRDIGVSAISGFAGVATTGLIVNGVKSLGNNIENGSTAGYPYVQAPGASTTTTNTLSGTGAIGGNYTPTTSTTSTTTTDNHAVTSSNNPVTNPIVPVPLP